MRCKEGDLAKVTGGSCKSPNNIGKLVVVGARFDAHPLPLPAWQVFSLSGPLRCLSPTGTRNLQTKAICPDAWLTPYSPPPSSEEASTAVKDAHELVE